MKLILKDKTELNLYSIPTAETKEGRKTINFKFNISEYKLDDIYNMIKNGENTEEFKLTETVEEKIYTEQGEITEEKEKEYIYSNYCIVYEACISDEVIETETAENAEIKEIVISITLAQLTYSELQQKKAQEKINELEKQNLMLMEAVAEIYESQIVVGAE